MSIERKPSKITLEDGTSLALTPTHDAGIEISTENGIVIHLSARAARDLSRALAPLIIHPKVTTKRYLIGGKTPQMLAALMRDDAEEAFQDAVAEAVKRNAEPEQKAPKRTTGELLPFIRANLILPGAELNIIDRSGRTLEGMVGPAGELIFGEKTFLTAKTTWRYFLRSNKEDGAIEPDPFEYISYRHAGTRRMRSLIDLRDQMKTFKKA